MRKIEVDKKYADEHILPFVNSWRTVAARNNVLSFICAMIERQRENAADEDEPMRAVEISSKMLEREFPKSRSRTKFRRGIKEYKIAIIGDSYVAQNIATEELPARSKRWVFIDPSGKATTTLEYEPVGRKFEDLSSIIHKAEGAAVNGTDLFKGSWAIEALKRGELNWGDFDSVGRTAKNIINGVEERGKDLCRVYTTVTLCKKTVRSRVFFNSKTGCAMQEWFDFHAAAQTMAPMGAAIASGTKEFCGYTSQDFHNWIQEFLCGVNPDPYKRYLKGVYEADPYTNVFCGKRELSKSERKTFKKCVQVTSNVNLDTFLGWKDTSVQHPFTKIDFNDIHFLLRRNWMVAQGIRKSDKNLWNVILRTKVNGLRGAFYRAFTLGEMVVMNTLLQGLSKRGFNVVRVHDAFWTTDVRLLSMKESDKCRLIGKILMESFHYTSRDNTSDMINLATAAGITREHLLWVRKGLVLEGAKANQFREYQQSLIWKRPKRQKRTAKSSPATPAPHPVATAPVKTSQDGALWYRNTSTVQGFKVEERQLDEVASSVDIREEPVEAAKPEQHIPSNEELEDFIGSIDF